MSETFAEIPQKQVFRIGVATLFGTLALWLVLCVAGAIWQGDWPSLVDNAFMGGVYFVLFMMRTGLPLLASLIAVQILWTPVFALISRAGMQLPTSAMLTFGLLAALPVQGFLVVFGRYGLFQFYWPMFLIYLGVGLAMSWRYSFDSNGEIWA